MITCDKFFKRSLGFAAALVMAGAPALAQQSVVLDWSTHHAVFSNPGSEMDALMNGKRAQWQAFVSNPRYQMQQLRRSPAWANRLMQASALSNSLENRFSAHTSNPKKGFWQAPIGPSGSGTPRGDYPAVFASSFTTASCSDFIVFPVDTAGKTGATTGQANFVGFNNLYSGTCTTGNVPSVAFAFFLGKGTFQTSPVISLDGTKIAFVESKNKSSGSRTNFHVLTLGTNGTDNGGPYNSPAVPHTIVDNGASSTNTATNNAVDTYVTLAGVTDGPDLTESSPYIDYATDTAYVGDDTGSLHKITGVFNGTPTEVTTGGWPAVTKAGVTLTGPVLDSLTGNILVGASDGDIYCIVSSTGAHCANSVRTVSNGSSASGAVVDAPVVVSDGTSSWVFSEAVATNTVAPTSEAVLFQADTNLTTASVVRVNMGDGGTDLYSGDFDNFYYTQTAGHHGGFLYFCGNLSGAATPALYRVGFNSDGSVVSANDGNSFQLVASGRTGTGVDCTPLTEVFNGTTDMLYLGVRGHGTPAGCTNQACIMSFTLGAPFPTAATAAFSLGGNNNGSSGIVIDNVSTQAGASQVYLSNLQSANSATQLSQSALK